MPRRINSERLRNLYEKSYGLWKEAVMISQKHDENPLGERWIRRGRARLLIIEQKLVEQAK
jgi:hypothetical protein